MRNLDQSKQYSPESSTSATAPTTMPDLVDIVCPGTLVAVQSEGALELFIVQEGEIWNYSPGKGKSYNSMSTGMQANSLFTANVDANGDIYVFAEQAGSIQYKVNPAYTLSPWKNPVQVSTPPNPAGINQFSQLISTRAYTGGIDIQLALLAPFVHPDTTESTYRLAYTDNDLNWTYNDYNVSEECVWIPGQQFGRLANAFKGWCYVYSASGNNEPEMYRVNSQLSVLSLAALSAGYGYTFYAVLSDGNIYQYVTGVDPTGAYNAFDVQALSQGISFGKVLVGNDELNKTHIFGLATDGSLYELVPAAGNNGLPYTAHLVLTGVADAVLAHNSPNNIVLCTIASTDRSVSTTTAATNGGWVSEKLQVTVQKEVINPFPKPVTISLAGIFHSDTPVDYGQVDNFLYSTFNEPAWSMPPGGFISQFFSGDMLRFLSGNGPYNEDPSHTPKEKATYNLFQAYTQFDYDVAAFIKNLPVATFSQPNGNPVITMDNGRITATIFYQQQNPRITNSPNGHGGFVFPEAGQSPPPLIWDDAPSTNLPSVNISFTNTAGLQKTICFLLEGITSTDTLAVATNAVAFIYVNFSSILRQVAPKLPGNNTSGPTYTYADIFNNGVTMNGTGVYVNDVNNGISQGMFKTEMGFLKVFLKNMFTSMFTEEGFDMMALAEGIASNIAMALVETAAEYFFFEVMEPAFKKPINTNLYIYNFSKVDVYFDPNIAVQEGFLLSNMNPYYQHRAYPNNNNNFTGCQVPVLQGAQTGNRVSYLPVRTGNNDGIYGIGSVVNLSWHDDNNTSNPLQTLAVGLAVPYVQTFGPHSLLANNIWNDTWWYNEDVESDGDTKWMLKYLMGKEASPATALNAALVFLRVPELQDTHIAVLYLSDGNVPMPKAMEAILNNPDPQSQLMNFTEYQRNVMQQAYVQPNGN